MLQNITKQSGSSGSQNNSVSHVTPTAIRNVADLFALVKQYDFSKPNKKNNTNADYFDYFVKTVQIDGKVFDLVADVEKDYGVKDGYVYTLALRDNKTIKASPANETSQSEPLQNAGNTLNNDILPQNPKKSNEKKQYSLSDIEGKPIDNARISSDEIDTRYSLSQCLLQHYQ